MIVHPICNSPAGQHHGLSVGMEVWTAEVSRSMAALTVRTPSVLVRFLIVQVHFCQWTFTVLIGLSIVPTDVSAAAAFGPGVPKLLALEALWYS